MVKMKRTGFSLLCYSVILLLSFQMQNTLQDVHNKFHEKIRKLLNEKRNGTDLFLNINEFEYPRSNETFRQIHKEQWLQYYECLKEKYAKVGVNKMIHPIALIALEGTTVTLECQICISPLEMYNTEMIQWYFNNTDNRIFNKPLDYSDNIVISSNDGSLVIYNLMQEQEGQYWCEMADTKMPVYYLHIDKESDNISTVSSVSYGPQPAPVNIIPEYSLKVYTTWTSWSPCSTCNKVGRKIRYGYCTVSILESSMFDNQNEVHMKLEETETDEESKFQLQTILAIFRNRLPCKSKYIPQQIRNVPSIKKRNTELMIRYCKIKCPENVIFEVRDKNGNVLESANNSAGIYSVMQGIPVPSPSVIRTTIYEKRNKKLTLWCPGIRKTDAPIVWQVGNKIINPSLINEQSDGRIYINSRIQIVFIKLRSTDSSLYSCWQQGELIGTIKLYVTEETEIKLNRYVIMIGGNAIITVFLIVFWKAFRRRREIVKR